MTEKNLELRPADFMSGSLPVETDQEIDLVELFYRMLDKFGYIAISAIVCMLIAVAFSFFIAVPKYQSTAKLYVINSKNSALNLSDLQISSYLTADYQEVFKTWEVHEMVLQELGLEYSYAELLEMLSVSNPSGTRILNITVSSNDPEEATNIANTYAKVSKKYISTTMATDEPNILSVALRPTKPVSPNKTKNALLGFVLGAILAVGIIVVQFVMDDKIKTTDDILRYTNLPTLAIVPVLLANDLNENRKRKRPREK